jgi:hypothetical protein
MSIRCQVPGCDRVRGKKGYCFFDFPRKNEERRLLWIKTLRLHGGLDEDWMPDDDGAVCSKHFISGRPRADRSHPDFVPTILPAARSRMGPRSAFSDVTELYDVKYKIKNGES